MPDTVPMHLVGSPMVMDVHDAGARDIPLEGDLTFFVEMALPFHGEPVESARILNNLVLSWVDANISSLDEIARPMVLSYLSEYYPEIDPGDMQDEGSPLIWHDQVDYLASIDSRARLVHFSAEVRPSLDPVDTISC